ncbi:MAG TPA: DoxX family protein [Gemmatimonadaceae bacterium]
MATLAIDARPARVGLWTGRALSTIVTLFLIFDGGIHLAKPAPVVDAFAQLGFPISLSVAIGAIELACLALHLLPRTAILGAVLLTGYLGGAIAAQLRIGAPVFNVIFPLIVAALLWGGLALRDRRIMGLIGRAD